MGQAGADGDRSGGASVSVTVRAGSPARAQALAGSWGQGAAARGRTVSFRASGDDLAKLQREADRFLQAAFAAARGGPARAGGAE